MTEHHPTTRGTSNNDLLGRLDRIEDLLTRRLDRQDGKLDNLSSRLDKMEGGLGMLKWLGPTGIAAVIFALAQSMGLIS